MQQTFLFDLGRLYRRWNALLHQRITDRTITRARWHTLFFLHHGGQDLIQRQLADLLSLDQPTMVRMLDTLQEQGLIERQASPRDRRAALVNLSKKGETLVKGLEAEAIDLQAKLTAGIAESDLARAAKVVTQILENSVDMHRFKKGAP